MTLDQFVDKWTGEFPDFDGNYGAQCMDNMHYYITEVLGLGRTVLAAPTAYDAYKKGDDNFEKIPNTPKGIPQRGDIMFWDTTVGESGHVAVFLDGTANTFRSFDVNWPLKSPAHVQSHNYNGVVGWLRPKHTQGDDVTTEQAVDLIYLTSRGHKPEGDERAFALGGIPMEDLASLRFKDDVIPLGWRASTGEECPESEKQHWATAFATGQDNPAVVLGNQWYGDHVKPKLDAAAKQQEQLQEVNNAQTAELNEIHDALQKANDQVTEAIQEKAKAAADLLQAQEDLKNCQSAAPATMTATEMIIEGIRKLLRISN